MSGSIKSLSDWVKTSAGSKRNSVGIWVTSISSVEKSRVSISITLTLTSTRDRDVSSINTGSTLQAKSVAEGIRIASNSSDEVLGGASGTGNKGGSYSLYSKDFLGIHLKRFEFTKNFIFDDAALILRIQLIPG